MKKKYTALFFAFISVACAVFTTCENPIMRKWWPGGSSAGGVNNDAPYQEGNFYTVKFDPDGGDPVPEDQRIAANSMIANVGIVTNGNSGLEGWFDAEDFEWDFATYRIAAEDVDKNGVLILKAKWNSTTYKVTFDSNQAKYYDYEDTYYDYDENDYLEKGLIPLREQYVVQNGLLIEPTPGTRKGFGFAGWYQNDSFSGEPWDFTKPVSIGMDLHARWVPDNLTVISFDSNGGSPSPEPQILAGDDNNKRIREPEAITRIGFGFGGWYDNQACTGEPWNFNNTVSGNSKILYAKWVTNLYTVTFIADGGSPAPAAIKVPYGAKIDAPPPMTKPRQGFQGWYRSSDFRDDHIWNFSTGTVTENMTLYAKWETAKYVVKFDSGGGSSVPAQPVADGGKATVPPDPTRSAYVFKGWYPAKTTGNDTWIFDDGDDNKHDDEISNTNGNLTFELAPDSEGRSVTTLYARWVKHNPAMAWIPGGSFTMGGLSGDGATSRPAHQVTVDGFYMWMVEMNQNSIDRITWWAKQRANGVASPNFTTGNYNFNSLDPINRGFNPSAAKGENRPIESITWYDAVYLCNLITDYENEATRPTISKFERPYIITNIKLATPNNLDTDPTNDTVYLTEDDQAKGLIKNYTVSIISADVKLNSDATYEKCGYRLPTEAEWEYAARGGNGSPGDFKWAGSNTPGDVAWFGGSGGNSGGKTQLLAQKTPNRFGIYDMSGNVCEWCWDQYDKTTYNPTNAKPIPSRTKPLGPSGTDGPDESSYGEERVRRGGSIRHTADNCRTQVRDSWGANKTDNWNIGFRIVRTAEE